MSSYKITRIVKELGMTVCTTIEDKRSIGEVAKTVNTPPKGLKRVLSKAISIENVYTGEVIYL